MFDDKFFKAVTDQLDGVSDKEKQERMAKLKKLAEAEIQRRKLNPKKKDKK